MHEHNFDSFFQNQDFLFWQMGRFGSKNTPSYFINGLTCSFKFYVDMQKFFFWVNGPFRAVKWHVLIVLEDKMK